VPAPHFIVVHCIDILPRGAPAIGQRVRTASAVARAGRNFRPEIVTGFGRHVAVSQITLAAAPFARTASGSCGNSLPFNLAANGNCTLSYTFGPNVFGPVSQPFSVTATGTGASGFTLQGNGIDRIFKNGFE